MTKQLKAGKDLKTHEQLSGIKLQGNNHPRYLAEEIRVVVDLLHPANELLQRLFGRRACDPFRRQRQFRLQIRRSSPIVPLIIIQRLRYRRIPS
jgi:hypothetical protein